MLKKRIRCIVFSPTGTTIKIVKKIAEGMGGECIVTDVSRPEVRECELNNFEKGDIAIVGAPVYNGTIPDIAKKYFGKIKANNIPAVAVVAYGNREYKNAVYDLAKICSDSGFKFIGGGAFIGEHSMSTKNKPIAYGRPDDKDLNFALEFGKLVGEKIDNIDSLEEMEEMKFPFDPKFKALSIPTFVPAVNSRLCTLCTTCEKVCPTGAMRNMDGVMKSDKGKCIMCCACIKNCPHEAIRQKNLIFILAGSYMHKTCSKRKEPEIYLG